MITLSDKEFKSLVDFVRNKYGINLEKKRMLIEGRMSNMLSERGLSSFSEYLEILFADKSGTEATNVLNRLTTNHTFFLREMEHWNFLTSHVLPYFERTIKNHDIRIWSAGCSSGQEPYNLAMAIDEYFGPNKGKWDTTILATDISMKALETAKKAVYSAEALKDVPDKWLKKYFIDNKDGTYRVCDKIRSQVIFRPGNLMEKFSFKKPMNFVWCRNVMIYFDTPTKDDLVERFYDISAPGAFLFIGHSEVVNKETSRYTYIKPAIYQKGV